MKKNNTTELRAREIRARMVRAGITGADVARGIGVAQETVSRVIHGRLYSERVRKAIADALGTTVRDLWPNDESEAA